MAIRSTEPAGFFDMALSTAQFYEEVKDWKDEVDTTWLRHKWYCIKETNFAGIEQRNQIWLELEQGAGESYRGHRVSNYVFELIDGAEKRFYLNRDHSWVKKMLKEMPCFVPRIMFRFCPKRCHEKKLRKPWDAMTQFREDLERMRN